jgi:putative transposase
MIDREHALPVTQQCRLVAVARSSVYYVPQPVAAAELTLMRQLDELHLQHPCAGSRMLRDLLRLQGVSIGRKHVATLMRRMGTLHCIGIPGIRKPILAIGVPYLLRNRRSRSNQVWAMTHVPYAPRLPVPGGRLDWATRRVLAWHLSNS